MPSSQEEQSILFNRYYDLVKTFNAVNQDYLQVLDSAFKSRQMAIEMAIEKHIKMQLDYLRDMKRITNIFLVISIIFLIMGLCSLQNTNLDQAIKGVRLILIIGIVMVVISFIANIWISDHIKRLDSEAREANERIHNLPKWFPR